MNEENKNEIERGAAEQAAPFLDEGKPKLSLKLGDPYTFDGEEVEVICLDGLFDMTAEDMCAIDTQMINRGYSGGNMEMTRLYAMLITAKVNKKPFEFCNKMKARDSIRLKQVVTAFFYARG